ncbi:MAG TPA: hypothetical protein VNE38_00825 [Ktedonobacteraceae bacterium]|nr:hypothetical protein [Ktedonobacteraceae bacterium]
MGSAATVWARYPPPSCNKMMPPSRYIEWGLQHPDKFKVLQQIGVSYELDDRVKSAGNEPFVEVERMTKESIEKGEIRNYPVAYLAAFMDNHAATKKEQS